MSKNYCSGNHILIGLGGTGGKILRAFKMRLFEEFPTKEERDKLPISLLYVDSTREMMPVDGRPRKDFRIMGMDASFTEDEFLFIKGNDVGFILDHINSFPNVKGIVKNAAAVKTAIGNIGEAAGQMRRAGRILFACNARAYVNALKNAFAKCNDRSNNDEKIYIYIFAGLCGGTGSGSVIDALVQARKAYPEANISVFAMIPEMHLPKANIDQGRYYQNGYAAVNELNALQAGRYIPHDVTGAGEEANVWSPKVHGVADGIVLYSNVNDNGTSINPFDELPRVVSDYIFAKVFMLNTENKACRDILSAYTFENMSGFEVEYDELDEYSPDKELRIARTKKINSFGIKRVMYPELRVLKHITYTIGEKILFQFKYNNWREELGFVDEEANKDYRELYLNDKNIQKWMLDKKHLTLDVKILPGDKDYPSIDDYWHDKALNYASDPNVTAADCPLNELDSLLGEFYAQQFRSAGVEKYYAGKTKAIPDMAREIRHNIESELFERWKEGDISIVELQKISKLLIEKVTEIRTEIEEEIAKTDEDVQLIGEDCKANVQEWSNLNLLQRLANVGNRIYGRHQTDLGDLYSARTFAVALQFARGLALKTLNEIQNMDADISAFSDIINKAISETETLISDQQKINNGIEDMSGAIVEVSEEEMMQVFEDELKVNKHEMPVMANKIRKTILPQTPFVSFGRLASELNVDNIKDAFDLELSKIVSAKHDELAESDKKVLGMNIITQLQQKLQNDDEIKSFAYKIVQQSGVYLKLDKNQIQMDVNNNESPATNPESIYKRAIFVSIPKPRTDSQKSFAKKLEAALKSSISQDSGPTLSMDMDSPRENELCIIAVSYCYPMRCAEWLQDYRNRYNRFLHTGNPITDRNNAILLHTEGDGTQLPSLFVVENAGEVIRQKHQAAAGPRMAPPPVAPAMPPIPSQVPQIQVYLAEGGQKFGPFDYPTCQSKVALGQLNKDSMVWMQGLSAWTPAAQVEALRPLFEPAMPPIPDGMPDLPPMM